MKFIYLTDTHIRDDNAEIVIKTFENALAAAKENDCEFIVHGGDLLDSRRQASIKTIRTLRKCIEIITSQMPLYAIAGNHDKSDQTISDSFVSAIADNIPNFYCAEFPKEICDNKIHLYPYFPENAYPDHDLEPSEEKIAICHASFVGAKNLGHESKHGLDPDFFADNYGLTLVGHFHNRNKLRHNVIYVGSTVQQNFGEDENKGFALVDTELMDIEYLQNDASPKYITHKVLVEVDQFVDLDKVFAEDGNYHRIELVGTKAAIAGVDRNTKKSMKIVERIIESDEESTENKIDFNKESIVEDFEQFCAQTNIEPETNLFKVGAKIMEN